ncbi:MAG: metallophosphoesterase [Acutalibacteraceae bacterium]|nr:metallophosphoesterase [Acutalibacteraceae bacterium]
MDIKERIRNFFIRFGFSTENMEDIECWEYPSFNDYITFQGEKFEKAEKVQPYLENKLNESVNKCKEAYKQYSDGSFAFTTDVHIHANTLTEIPMLKYLAENRIIDKAFCGGDFVWAFGTKEFMLVDAALSMEYVKAINTVLPFYITRGNHDFTVRYTSERNCEGDYIGEGYTLPFNKTCEIIMSHQPKNIKANHNCMYFYTDNETEKIRYIVLDTHSKNHAAENTPWGIAYGFDKEQLDWLVNDALQLPYKDEWTVIVFGHIPCVESLPDSDSVLGELAEVLKDFKNKRKGKYADFTNSKGEFAAYICGHNHKDASVVEDGTLFISTGCSSYCPDDGIDRTVGSENEVLFDVFLINKTDKKIKAVRFGAGSDREFSY